MEYGQWATFWGGARDRGRPFYRGVCGREVAITLTLTLIGREEALTLTLTLTLIGREEAITLTLVGREEAITLTLIGGSHNPNPNPNWRKP